MMHSASQACASCVLEQHRGCLGEAIRAGRRVFLASPGEVHMLG